MRKGQKVKHTNGCRNGRCRGKCVEQNAEIERRNKLRAEESKECRKESCPSYHTNIMNAPGIGPYCPNKDCHRADNLHEPESDVFVFRGPSGGGKTGFWMKEFAENAREPSGGPNFTFKMANGDLWKQYRTYKDQSKADVDRNTYWQTFGRLLGAAYADGDDAFFAMLEGFYRGQMNRRKRRNAME